MVFLPPSFFLKFCVALAPPDAPSLMDLSQPQSELRVTLILRCFCCFFFFLFLPGRTRDHRRPHLFSPSPAFSLQDGSFCPSPSLAVPSPFPLLPGFQSFETRPVIGEPAGLRNMTDAPLFVCIGQVRPRFFFYDSRFFSFRIVFRSTTSPHKAVDPTPPTTWSFLSNHFQFARCATFLFYFFS